MDFMLMVFIFVLCISAMGMFADYRKQQLKMLARMNDMEQGAVQKDLAAIKQRLAVLEKIVTDRRYDLDEELTMLRNKN